MNRWRSRLAPALTLLALVLGAPALLAAEKLTLDCNVIRVVNSKKLVVAVPEGEYKGRWNLELRQPAPEVKQGQSGRIRADRQVLQNRRGRASVSFKGSDEELQAIIDWLGSLEAKRR